MASGAGEAGDQLTELISASINLLAGEPHSAEFPSSNVAETEELVRGDDVNANLSSATTASRVQTPTEVDERESGPALPAGSPAVAVTETLEQPTNKKDEVDPKQQQLEDPRKAIREARVKLDELLVRTREELLRRARFPCVLLPFDKFEAHLDALREIRNLVYINDVQTAEERLKKVWEELGEPFKDK